MLQTPAECIQQQAHASWRAGIVQKSTCPVTETAVSVESFSATMPSSGARSVALWYSCAGIKVPCHGSVMCTAWRKACQTTFPVRSLSVCLSVSLSFLFSFFLFCFVISFPFLLFSLTICHGSVMKKGTPDYVPSSLSLCLSVCLSLSLFSFFLFYLVLFCLVWFYSCTFSCCCFLQVKLQMKL